MGDNGGKTNANTNNDYTNYHFDVASAKFPEAVDIFSQFFKEPLFNHDAVDREMHAVDSEYNNAKSDEPHATDYIEKSQIAVPGSVIDHFSVGSLETLQVEGAYENLKKFYEDNYSSNRMNLVLVGKQSLEELQKIAYENFKDVQNKNLPAVSYKNETVFTREHSFGRIYKVIPYKDLRQLTIKWYLNHTDTDWSKSAEYIGTLFGSEGTNSLQSYLIKEGLGTKVSVGNG
jgi:secreted Zn-dependent insulinase-like peptidase